MVSRQSPRDQQELYNAKGAHRKGEGKKVLGSDCLRLRYPTPAANYYLGKAQHSPNGNTETATGQDLDRRSPPVEIDSLFRVGAEDVVLFPMAASAIPASEHEQLLSDFERVEEAETGEGVHDKYVALAGKLERQVGA